MIDENFVFLDNTVFFRAKGFILTFTIYPRKKVINLKQNFVGADVSPKNFHKTMNRVLKVIRAYYNFD